MQPKLARTRGQIWQKLRNQIKHSNLKPISFMFAAWTVPESPGSRAPVSSELTQDPALQAARREGGVPLWWGALIVEEGGAPLRWGKAGCPCGKGSATNRDFSN